MVFIFYSAGKLSRSHENIRWPLVLVQMREFVSKFSVEQVKESPLPCTYVCVDTLVDYTVNLLHAPTIFTLTVCTHTHTHTQFVISFTDLQSYCAYDGNQERAFQLYK